MEDFEVPKKEGGLLNYLEHEGEEDEKEPKPVEIQGKKTLEKKSKEEEKKNRLAKLNKWKGREVNNKC